MTTFNEKLWHWRNFKDQFASGAVKFGGVCVIATILLILFYLVFVVLPIFKSAEIHKIAFYDTFAPGERTLLLDLEEQGGVAVRYQSNGNVVYFQANDGDVLEQFELPLPLGVDITAISLLAPAQKIVALGTSNGQVLLVKHDYKVSYPDNKRTIDPELIFPFGPELISLEEEEGVPINQLSFVVDEDKVGILARTRENRLIFVRWNLTESFIDGSLTLELDERLIYHEDQSLAEILLAPDLTHALAATTDNRLFYYAIEDGKLALIQEITQVVDEGDEITCLQFLLGNTSVLIGDSHGEVAQWIPVRDEDNHYQFKRVRSFFIDDKSPVSTLVGEHRRKGFLVGTEGGQLGIFYATSGRTLLQAQITDAAIVTMAISVRGKTLLVEDLNGRFHLFEIQNDHPEISWSALWSEIWYEGYQDPEYTWQSSAATNDFEPKFSLIPLSFGTLKAAFYAMLFAMPLAIMGAIFTAQFMAPAMRKLVKPTIEIMEALPTVILGFLAGLWLAPILENHLLGIFSMLLIMPLGFLAAAIVTHYLPVRYRNAVEGWETLVLVPLVVLLGWFAITISVPLEKQIFDGDIQAWIYNTFGVRYDQRNSLVVGLAMGFAVIPTIFTLAEDALFSVPQHLVRGSLALGATRWQSLVYVVLPTASPAIFAAIMMGFGRAVGETMIVLMATGNTPVLDFSIFNGMRTLAANIAVEMPEAEVGSSHYRVLFLAALVLFMFTFVFNTVAEVVRQRLRRKYSSL